MLSFEQFCKELKIKNEKIKDSNVVTHYHDTLFAGKYSDMSISREFYDRGVLVHLGLSRFYNEVYLNQFNLIKKRSQ